MTDLFFVCCPESGFDCFLTRDAALDEANERIQGYLGDGWSEEVTGVCVGKITHRAKMCDQVFPDGEIDEDGNDEAREYWDPDWDYKCNYKMLPVEQNPAPEAAKLVEALDRIKGMDSMSYHSLESAKIVARNALADYRAQGGDL